MALVPSWLQLLDCIRRSLTKAKQEEASVIDTGMLSNYEDWAEVSTFSETEIGKGPQDNKVCISCKSSGSNLDYFLPYKSELQCYWDSSDDAIVHLQYLVSCVPILDPGVNI